MLRAAREVDDVTVDEALEAAAGWIERWRR
jgi:hypothetical protein